MALIAIDMTPLLPGGENGGVKLLAVELVRGFQVFSPENEFLLLTAAWNDNELSFLDNTNVHRLCVVTKRKEIIFGSSSYLNYIEIKLRHILRLLRRHYHEKINQKGFLSSRGADVLFCPFTAPTYAEPGIPVVSLVCDLQHKDYPHFFDSDEIYARESFLGEVQKRADAVICISESTRQAVLKHLKTNPDKTHTIHISIHSRLIEHNINKIEQQLQKLRINNPYMFYPANFWPHKNHRMLLTAYGMYISRHPESRLDLVFTGALDEAQHKLQSDVKQMGLERRVHFLGYLPEDQLTAVWQGCSFLVFPSLYEGFGIPVLEAMQFGKPVICSNVTSLPEVAGDAALYFDPRKPEEIVKNIEKIMGNEELYADLVRRGNERLSNFQFQDMVEKYLHVIEGVIGKTGIAQVL